MALIAIAISKTNLFPTSLKLEVIEVELPTGVLTEEIVIQLFNQLVESKKPSFDAMVYANGLRAMLTVKEELWQSEVKVLVIQPVVMGV